MGFSIQIYKIQNYNLTVCMIVYLALLASGVEPRDEVLVDRFVPLGKSLDFNLVWDGYDLITTLSRIVQVM